MAKKSAAREPHFPEDTLGGSLSRDLSRCGLYTTKGSGFRA